MLDKSEIAKQLLSWQRRLESQRSSTERTWSEIAQFIRPERNSFNGQSARQAAINIFDSTAILASEFLASSLWSMVSSSSNHWFHVKPKDISLLKNPSINQWFIEVNNIMKKELLDVNSGFYHKSYEFYSDLVCFGTAIFYVGENLQTGAVEYSCKDLASCFLDFGPNGRVDVMFRRLHLQPQVAIDHFGLDNIPEDLLKAYKDNYLTKYSFIHAVVPISYLKDYSSSLQKSAYVSFYIEASTGTIVSESYYQEFPYIVARWFTSPNNIYGDSPAVLALPDIKMLNAISKTMIVALQKQVDPPILAPNEASVQGLKTHPGGIIYGGIDPLTGNQLFRPLINPVDLNGVSLIEEQKRNSVREAFYFSLLLSAYAKNATATEVLSINEQRMQLLGAKVARIQTEFLSPLLFRQYKVLKRLQKFPEMPNNMEIPDIEIEFFGIWNRYQKVLDSIGINKLISLVQQVKNLYPDAGKHINWVEALKIFGEGSGVPSEVFNFAE